MTTTIVGASIKRSEDRRLITGTGRYVDDVTLPGLLHMAIVRSPYAHARIGKIDVSQAAKHPDVGIGPVRGSYQGVVEITDRDPPRAYTLRVEGKGPGAFINGVGRIVLSEGTKGKTRVDVDGNAEVGGVLARVGQRMMGNATKTIMRQFFGNVKKRARQTTL